MRKLIPEPLTAEAFSAFGEVIDLQTARQVAINCGLTTRFNDLATIDVDDNSGRPSINIFRSNPVQLPHTVKIMERHPLGSQAFIPTANTPFLVLVAKAGDTVHADDLRLFISDGELGVNYFKNTWHHYQMVLGVQANFVVIDRAGKGENLVEVEILGKAVIGSHNINLY